MKSEKKEMKPSDRIKFIGNELFVLQRISQDICGARATIDYIGQVLKMKIDELFKQIKIFRPETDGWEMIYDHIKHEIVMQYKK